MDQETLAISVLVTKQEYDNGHVHAMMEQYLMKQPSSHCKVPWYIIFDQGDVSQFEDLYKYESHQSVEKIEIVSINIPDHENFYSHVYHEKEIISEFERLGKPVLGMCSGPNHLFFRAMEHMFQTSYDNILLLETDTRPVCDDWYDKLQSAATVNNFMIMGSVYKGIFKFCESDHWWAHNHLNGVAIYKNTEHTKSLLCKTEQYIKHNVAGSYDLIIKHNIQQMYAPIDEYDTDLKELRLNLPYDISIYFTWHENQEMYVDAFTQTNLIACYSGGVDEQTTIEEILTRFPELVILHQKYLK